MLYNELRRNVCDHFHQYFVSKGGDVNAKDGFGITPLREVAGKGNVEAVKFLVPKGANVNTKDNNGFTPLHTATEGNIAVVKFLVAKGADVRAENKYGKTPLDLAKERNNTEVVAYLSGLERIKSWSGFYCPLSLWERGILPHRPPP